MAYETRVVFANRLNLEGMRDGNCARYRFCVNARMGGSGENKHGDCASFGYVRLKAGDGCAAIVRNHREETRGGRMGWRIERETRAVSAHYPNCEGVWGGCCVR